MKTLTKYVMSEYGGRAIRRASIEGVCEKFEANPTNIINNMISYGYLVRILRGLYYVKTLEEFAWNRAVDVYRVIALGMGELGVGWYFGLYTALRMNGATHEFSDTIAVLNDKVFRPREVKIAGEKVRFVKLSPRLFGFGVLAENGVKYSDLEKTLLDMAYLSKYRSVPEGKIASMIEEYAKGVNVERIKEYLSAYPLTVGKVVKDAGLI